MRPGPPENLKLEALPSNNLQLTFTIPRALVHFPIGLIYSVNYKSSWDEDWSSMEPETIKDKQEVTCNLENLQYAWTEYSVEVIIHCFFLLNFYIFTPGKTPFSNSGQYIRQSLLERCCSGRGKNPSNRPTFSSLDTQRQL